MMLNAIRNKVLGGEKITVEEARWLSCQAEKQDLYDAAHGPRPAPRASMMGMILTCSARSNCKIQRKISI